MQEYKPNKFKDRPSANDRCFVGIEEQHILERARLLADFIKNDAATAKSIVHKAKIKFSILGTPEAWDPKQYEKIDEFIDLSVFSAAQSDILRGKPSHYSNPEDVIKSVHMAMDRVAREMPQMIGR